MFFKSTSPEGMKNQKDKKKIDNFWSVARAVLLDGLHSFIHYLFDK